MAGSVARQWERYWFAGGGRYSIAIIRVAIAIAVWLSLDMMRDTWVDIPSYRAVGLWQLLGASAPSHALVEVLWIVARVATVAMALGALSRIATLVSFIAGVLLASLYYSGTPTWSHEYNVVFLAQLALLGGRCGDALAIDALIWPRRQAAQGYQWSLRLVQLAVALMFASGMFHKILHGGVGLHWALSDNLRNQIVVHFDAGGLDRTPVAEWLVNDVWKFRTAALMNLVTQLVPLAACVFVRRPIVRAMCGACFVLEVIALGLVMDLWNLHWIPLAVVFVDWDRLLRRPEGPAPDLLVARRSRMAVTSFIAVFVAVDLVASLVPRLDQRMNAYPLTGFPMFATIRAAKPYNRHAPYSFEGGHIELVFGADAPRSLIESPGSAGARSGADAPRRLIELELDRYYKKLFRVRDRAELRARLGDILASARRMYPATTAVRMYYAVFEVPAYPAPARLDRKLIAVVGELSLDGTFRSLLGTAHDEGNDIVLSPGEVATGTMAYYADQSPEPHPLAGLRTQRPRGRKLAYVLDTGQQRWLIYQAPR